MSGSSGIVDVAADHRHRLAVGQLLDVVALELLLGEALVGRLALLAHRIPISELSPTMKR